MPFKRTQTMGTAVATASNPSEPALNAPDALEALVRERTGGAVNLRGMLYQIIYSAARAAELPQTSADTRARLQFEGVEDLDAHGAVELRPLRAPSTEPGIEASGPAPDEVLELIQVKTSDIPWTWSRLRPVIRNFLEALRTGHPGILLRLVVNFPLNGELNDLSVFHLLPRESTGHIRNRFRKECKKAGGTHAEADVILERLRLEHLPEAEARARLRRAVTSLYGLGDTSAAAAYELALVGQTLQWARGRAVVTRADVLDMGRQLAEGLSRQANFEAAGRHWVTKPSYTADANPDDFYEARRARFGHIAKGLDVARPEWTTRIDAALHKGAICVLRAPSGQGKTTLAQRYVFERWPADSVVLIQAAGTQEEVGSIRAYLSLRAGLGLPIRVLIDADHNTRLWPYVAETCASLGLPTIVTVRVEDWHRYALESLTRLEIIEPTLGPDEAARIFAMLYAQGRVHPSVEAAEYAYERIGKPPLLLEFVYFVTHGRMLEERLRDQVRAMRREPGENDSKVEILRRVATAEALGAPLLLDRLLESLPGCGDPQTVIGSLLGEYLELEGGLLRGLHWVRSEHLARILHESELPPFTITALHTLPCVPDSALRTYVANAFSWPGLDEARFFMGLVERFGTADLEALLAVVEGVFEAGERRFFERNRPRFDHAYRLRGPSGAALLSYQLAPVLRVAVLSRMAAIVPQAPVASELLRVSQEIESSPRGMDFVRRLLENIAPRRVDMPLWEQPSAGAILDWFALAGVRLPIWSTIRSMVVESKTGFRLPFDAFCTAAFALARYDRDAYEAWYARHEFDLLAFLQLGTDALTLRILPTVGGAIHAQEGDASRIDDVAPNDALDDGDVRPRVELSYFVEDAGDESANAQSVRRLSALRQALPLMLRYDAQGERFLPEEIRLPVDDSRKHIPRRNLPAAPDVAKNVTWAGIVSAAYYPDSHFRLLGAWHRVREVSLVLLEVVNRVIDYLLQGRTQLASREQPAFNSSCAAFEEAARVLPRLDIDDMQRLGRPLTKAIRALVKGGSTNRWIRSLENFVRHFVRAYNGGRTDTQACRLAVSSIHDSAESLVEMQAAFSALFRDVPDYHGSQQLDARELRTYDEARLLVEGLLSEPITVPDPSPLRTLRARSLQHERRRLEKVRAALAPLASEGISTLGPIVTRRVKGLRVTAVGVESKEWSPPLGTNLQVARALSAASNDIDVVHIVPMQDGERLGSVAYVLQMWHFREGGVLGRGEFKKEDPAAMTLLLGLSIPQPLTEDVSSLLPPLKERKPPAPSLEVLLAALRTGADVYERSAQTVAAIMEAGMHPMRQELQRRQEAKLEPLVSELRTLLTQAQEALLVASSEMSEESQRYAKDLLNRITRIARRRSPSIGEVTPR